MKKRGRAWMVSQSEDIVRHFFSLTLTYLGLPAEVELEEAWLMEAGLSSLVTASSSEEAMPPVAEALLSTLTRQQAATVRKRLDNYNQTLKTRNRQPIRDVRDIFTEVGHTH